jgi:hypothetical protein
VKDRYAVEVRKLSVKVREQDTHIDILHAQVDDLKRAIHRANELLNVKNRDILKLEDFVKFANEYYPGSVGQYHAIKKLEDTR